MAQDRTFTLSTIGTASRNFIDVTTWDASFQSDFRTGGGFHEHGDMFADSTFTDTLVEMGPSVLSRVAQACAVTLSNAPGEKPVWKPSDAGTVDFFLRVTRGGRASGIEFDGATKTISASPPSNAMIVLTDSGGAGGTAKLYGCTVKNSSRYGISTQSAGKNIFLIEFCEVYDNALSGLLLVDNLSANTNMGTARFCGFGFNGAWGIESNTSGGNAESCFIPNCWFRGNTTGSVEKPASGSGSSFVVMDDQRFTDLSLPLNGEFAANVLENATQSQFAFANESGRDFTPGSGSVLLGEAENFGQDFGVGYPFDVKRNRLKFDWSNLLDVGPIQSKVFAPDPKFILPITATVGIQDEPSGTVKVVFP